MKANSGSWAFLQSVGLGCWPSNARVEVDLSSMEASFSRVCRTARMVIVPVSLVIVAAARTAGMKAKSGHSSKSPLVLCGSLLALYISDAGQRARK